MQTETATGMTNTLINWISENVRMTTRLFFFFTSDMRHGPGCDQCTGRGDKVQ